MSCITRYHKPTKYDTYEIGTICKTLKDMPDDADVYCFKEEIKECERFEFYIQLSENKQKPRWRPIGEFFAKIFDQKLQEEEFIKEALKIYKNAATSFLALSKTLKQKNN